MTALLPTAPLLAATGAWEEPVGYRHFYNLEYDQALRAFEADVAARPNDPNGHNRIANTLLYRRLYQAGALDSELAGSSNPFLRRPPVTMPAEEEKRFMASLERAIALAEGTLKSNPKDPGSLYAVGVSYALRGNHALFVRKAYWDALRDGNRSRDAHERLHAAQPDNPDALLVLGVHEYIVGSLPRAVRMMVAMAGIRGNREEGLRMLAQCATQGQRARTEARVMLGLLSRREKTPEKALPHLQELVRAYPRNHLYRSELAVVQTEAGRKAEALRTLDEMERLQKSSAPELSRMSRESLQALRGNLLFRLGEWDQAAATLQPLLSQQGKVPANLMARSALRVGQVADLKGRRDEARRHYEQAIAAAPESDYAKESRQYVASAFRAGQ